MPTLVSQNFDLNFKKSHKQPQSLWPTFRSRVEPETTRMLNSNSSHSTTTQSSYSVVSEYSFYPEKQSGSNALPLMFPRIWFDGVALMNIRLLRSAIRIELSRWDVTACNLADLYQSSNNTTAATDRRTGAIVSQKALLCLYRCQTCSQDTPRRCFIVRRPR
jgi:hypothetical protein